MLTILWADKGGSGTTVAACAVALVQARRGDALLVDLAGDVPAALGIPDIEGPGVTDWVGSATAGEAGLAAVAVSATPSLRVVGRGGATPATDHPRWAELGAVAANLAIPVVIDGGLHPPPALVAACAERLLVTRSCYLALRRRGLSPLVPTGVILLAEPGRALRPNDVAAAARAPLIAEVPLDPAIARAVDAGLLRCRMPRSLTTSMSEVGR